MNGTSPLYFIYASLLTAGTGVEDKNLHDGAAFPRLLSVDRRRRLGQR